MTSCDNTGVPAGSEVRAHGTFLGLPYVLGPVVGHYGAYAIVDWIRWNGAIYSYNGLASGKTDRISVSMFDLIVPPGLHYKRMNDPTYM